MDRPEKSQAQTSSVSDQKLSNNPFHLPNHGPTRSQGSFVGPVHSSANNSINNFHAQNQSVGSRNNLSSSAKFPQPESFSRPSHSRSNSANALLSVLPVDNRRGPYPAQALDQSRSHSPYRQMQPPKPPISKNSLLLSQLTMLSDRSLSRLKSGMQRKRKLCFTCGRPINGQFVRALGNAYHVECFRCDSCGKQCSSKFFPHERPNESGEVLQVPLCEYDYFKKLDLMCFDCDTALRGPYITALGNKYHLDHFKCYECKKVFDAEESYYEHENHVYCHYHYSLLFATKCEGCKSSIVKQFVELFKGGKNQQWHPECYMVFKFWNVTITAEAVGLTELLHVDLEQLDISKATSDSLTAIELQIERVVMNCWVVLSSFEETTAACISEMLLAACTGRRGPGLETTAKFVACVEILFQALDVIQAMCLECKPESANDSKTVLTEEVYSLDAFDKFQRLRKEPRNLSGKLMSYLAILRKSTQLSGSGTLSAELLSVVTGCAHYLKLLLRIGLNNAIRLNKSRGDTKATDQFLSAVKQFEEVEPGDKLLGDPISSRLAISSNATDLCHACKRSLEKSCVRFKNMRWHLKCLECSRCHRTPSQEFIVESFLYGADDLIMCLDCSKNSSNERVGYTSGFSKVSDLSQLAYLLKIAIYRSHAAIKRDDEALNRTSSTRPTVLMHDIEEEPSESEHLYSQTLQEVTAMRQKRESQILSTSLKKKARKSVIVGAPEAETARQDLIREEVEERPGKKRSASSASTLSFVPSLQDSDQFEFNSSTWVVREEAPRNNVPNSLDRTSDLLKNEKSLTLDDIPRIVAAEQAREQRPNAFRHHSSLYLKKQQPLRSLSGTNASLKNKDLLTNFTEAENLPTRVGLKHYSELTKKEHFVLRHIAIEALLEVHKSLLRDELLSFIESKKGATFWDKFRFGSASDKSKHVNVFGVDLRTVTRKYGVDSDLGVGPARLRIPIIVDDIINALRQKDMSVEGIFRLNGNIKNLRELTEHLNKTPLKPPEYAKYSAVQLAALVKKWLRDLPDPLLTFALYPLWISAKKEQDPQLCKRILQLASCLLPRSNRNLLEVLLYFFSWVASFAEIDKDTGSKMDTHNLATVIAPNILLSKPAGSDPTASQPSESHFLAIEVVNNLIEIHEDLASVPADLWDFYEKCDFQSSLKTDSMSLREISNRISKTLKENPRFFATYAATRTRKDLEPQASPQVGQMKALVEEIDAV